MDFYIKICALIDFAVKLYTSVDLYIKEMD